MLFNVVFQNFILGNRMAIYFSEDRDNTPLSAEILIELTNSSGVETEVDFWFRKSIADIAEKDEKLKSYVILSPYKVRRLILDDINYIQSAYNTDIVIIHQYSGIDHPLASNIVHSIKELQEMSLPWPQ